MWTYWHALDVRGLPSSIIGQDLVESIEVDCSLVITDLLQVNIEEDPLKQSIDSKMNYKNYARTKFFSFFFQNVLLSLHLSTHANEMGFGRLLVLARVYSWC